MANTTTKLIAELNTLLRLTQTEELIAQARRPQARDEKVERELADNAAEARDRSRLISQTIRDLGGVPDVIGMAAGRFFATAKTQIEQGQTLSNALLSDLALEQQLRDRARFVKILAETAGKAKVVQLAERLEQAHTQTVDWINGVLVQVAVGGPAALRPTPVQAVVGFGRTVASFPLRTALGAINRSLSAFEDVQTRAQDVMDEGVNRAQQLAGSIDEIWTAGRDAALERAEGVSLDDGNTDAARTVRKARRNLGALNADELPIKGYDDLTADVAIQRLQKLDSAQDVRTVLLYEEANKARKGVVSAAQSRLDEIAREVGVNA